MSRFIQGALRALAFMVVLTVGQSCVSAAPDEAAGPPPPQYVSFGGNTQASLWLPDPALYPDASTAILIAHGRSNTMNHAGLSELRDRGFIGLGMVTHAVNNEGAMEFSARMPRDIRAGVDYLYDVVGVETLVLLGHSSGGNTLSFYQAIAEKGLEVCRGPGKIYECPEDDRLVGPPADAFVFMDSNVGFANNLLRRLNPAVINEADPTRLDPTLNPFLERNGYNADGCSSYSQEFQDRYFRAQAARSQRLTERALAIFERMRSGTHVPTDNALFAGYRINARLYDMDNTIHGETKEPRKLLRDDREIVTQVVRTVRPCGEPLGYSTREVDATLGRTRDMTVRTLVDLWSVRATHSMDEIDYCSSNASTLCMVQHISAPSLFATAQGNPYMVDNEQMFELSGAIRKDYVVIEGATHGMSNCEACEGAPYHNVRANFYDYLAAWINSGFQPVTALP